MQIISLFQVDAFTDRLFGGNPAAVCPLQQWLSDEVLLQIAAENNLSETAFFVPEGDGYRLRWFTPEVEMDLCGHATLASAHVLFKHLHYNRPVINFYTRSGLLTVTNDAPMLTLDFPARVPKPVACPDNILQALGAQPSETLMTNSLIAVFDNEQTVRNMKPDFVLIKQMPYHAVIVTARGSQADFVSRFFAPGVGINEDPVTGSAHTGLVPFWAERLGKNDLLAHQISSRGGVLHCSLSGNRVKMSGHAVTYLTGQAYI